MKGDIVPVHWQILLREIRKDAGLSMRQVAEKANISQRTIAEYENTKAPRHLSIYKIEKILSALGYEIDFFLKPGGTRVIQKDEYIRLDIPEFLRRHPKIKQQLKKQEISDE